MVLQLQIIVQGPVPGCTYALQRGRADVDQAQLGSEAAADLTFATAVELRTSRDGRFDVRGPHVQGPLGGRFLYINSGTLAAQANSCWTRRAKVQLGGLAALSATGDGPQMAVAHISGRAADAGPACATVPILKGGWQLRVA